MKPPEIASDETIETLGPYFFIQRKAGPRLTSDTVALADFAAGALTENDTVIDLGTSTGALALLVSFKAGARRICGVEIDDEAASVARRNVEANGLNDRIEIVTADYRELAGRYARGSFSAVVSNPPYTKAGQGRVSPKKERAGARCEMFGGLEDLVAASAHLAGDDGRIFFVFPVARLSEMMEEAGRQGLKVRRLVFAHPGPKRPASVFLVELGRQGALEIGGPVFL